MILVIGGASQGKTEYAVRQLGLQPAEMADGASCSIDELGRFRGVDRFHLLVKRLLSEGQDVSSLADQLWEINPELVVIVNELGCGIVPMDPADRLWREKTGRVCCELTQKAEKVYRVFCGIGAKIK